MTDKPPKPASDDTRPAAPAGKRPPQADKQPEEIGGPKGPEPTRYGDWEIGARCIDF